MVRIQLIGRQIIKVTHVSNIEFENNPNMIWNYDVILNGTWDAMPINEFNNNTINILSNYIDKGKGILTGNDTITGVSGDRGISKLSNKFNIVKGYGSDLSIGWIYRI